MRLTLAFVWASILILACEHSSLAADPWANLDNLIKQKKEAVNIAPEVLRAQKEKQILTLLQTKHPELKAEHVHWDAKDDVIVCVLGGAKLEPLATRKLLALKYGRTIFLTNKSIKQVRIDWRANDPLTGSGVIVRRENVDAISNGKNISEISNFLYERHGALQCGATQDYPKDFYDLASTINSASEEAFFFLNQVKALTDAGQCTGEQGDPCVEAYAAALDALRRMAEGEKEFLQKKVNLHFSKPIPLGKFPFKLLSTKQSNVALEELVTIYGAMLREMTSSGISEGASEIALRKATCEAATLLAPKKIEPLQTLATTSNPTESAQVAFRNSIRKRIWNNYKLLIPSDYREPKNRTNTLNWGARSSNSWPFVDKADIVIPIQTIVSFRLNSRGRPENIKTEESSFYDSFNTRIKTAVEQTYPVEIPGGIPKNLFGRVGIVRTPVSKPNVTIPSGYYKVHLQLYKSTRDDLEPLPDDLINIISSKTCTEDMKSFFNLDTKKDAGINSSATASPTSPSAATPSSTNTLSPTWKKVESPPSQALEAENDPDAWRPGEVIIKDLREAPEDKTYSEQVSTSIKSRWKPPRKIAPGKYIVVQFFIGKDGSISGERIIQSSGSSIIDQSALLAVKAASLFPPPASVLKMGGYGNKVRFDMSFRVPYD